MYSTAYIMYAINVFFFYIYNILQIMPPTLYGIWFLYEHNSIRLCRTYGACRLRWCSPTRLHSRLHIIMCLLLLFFFFSYL